MILVFGGTTEGRIAVDVCEQAGKPFYYSTKSGSQEVMLHNGQRLIGGMTAENIKNFCETHDIKCIVDAAHPFAEALHENIANSGVTVIRLRRKFSEHRNDVTYLRDWREAVKEIRCKKLLALSGVNTISKLKDYWEKHDTMFRILPRKESMDIVSENGFPEDKLLYYPVSKVSGVPKASEVTMPSLEDEKAMMKECGCDAILTKESGGSGGYEVKVQAALGLGLKVYVVECPASPKNWIFVDGQHSLRRAIQSVVPEFFPLKIGLTTGACATAATKAALISLLTDEFPEEVMFSLPDGEVLTIPILEVSKVSEGSKVSGLATVVKEQNDDYDVTKGCRITAKVRLRDDERIVFLQGSGVGRVTLPGLGIPVGEPAINPTPRKMISDEIRSLTSSGVDIEISVEDGEALWHKTFNHKVGVIGGISIIGTSGIVSPLSNEAFVESIGRELRVARAIGCTAIGFASGKKGENALKAMEPDLRVVHYGNFIGEALKKAHKEGFQRVVLGIMIGKAVKLADGHLDTHSHKVAADLSRWGVKMARELWGVMPPSFFKEIEQKCTEHCRKVFPDGELEVHLIKDEK